MSPGAINTLPSPPETHSSYFGSIHTVPVHQRPMATPGSSLDFSLPPPMETPTSRFRRGPTIGYHSAGLRDSRERNGSTGSKFLVIVVPPHSVTQEHGNLGHTLSSGPAHRLSQGLIMPLFPTMYGQLTAIAREFNFPSSAGICLYYCYSEHGITMTPRLSDDIWPTIWGINEPSERRSPIVGKLEFDLDMAQARWYTAWLSSRHRESTENALPQGPTTAPSLQFRGDNRFSFPPTASEDGTVDHHSPQQRSAPVITRHVPRKLSLVDRFDTHHVANTETRRPRASASPPSGLPLSSHILSPITQQEEPKSARNTLDERVKSWRQSAVVNSPIELESSGAEIVVTQSPEQSPGSQSSFHLEDYAFSISSAGPDDSTSIASYHQDYLPSVHLCDRVNGSVCMTASYRTSAGPPSDYEFYYEPSEDDARLPSPDIAWRMFEEAPPTPRTATSWGPPSPGSLALSFDAYSPSLDLAHRAYFSCPSTPGTATSWGAPSFDGAYSVASQRSAFSIHLCDRGEYSRPPTPRTATSWGPPSCDFEAPSPYRLPSPDAAHRTFEDAAEWEMRASMLDAWRRALAEDVEEEEMEENVAEESSVSAAAPWAHSWPYRKAGVSLKTVATAVSAFSASKARAGSDEDRVSSEAEPLSRNAVASVSTAEVQSKPAQEATPWAHSWPYRKAGVSLKTVAKAVSAFSTPASRVARAEQAPLSKPAPSEEDAVKPWAHSWPYRKPASLKTVAKAVSGFALQKVSKEKKKSSTSRTSSSVSSPSEYPFFVLYPPVYPHFDLYPPVAGTSSSHNDSKSHLSPVEMSSNSGYPSFVLYPPVYPYFDLYPSIKYEGDEAPVSQRKTAPINMSPYSGYPSFVLYPPVYPYFDLYPAIKYERNETSVSRRTTAPISMSPNSGYPSFVLYPPVYPYFDLYPAMKYERNETSISQRKPIDMSPNAGYPSFVIYAPVYPYFALYPPVQGETPVVQQKALMAASCAGYPSFVLYPAGYPHNLTEIYPGVALSDRRPQKAQEPSVSTVENPLSVFASYPSLCIYFPSYPHNVSNIYPTVQREAIVKEASLPQPCRVELNEYPSLIIYSPVYPYNLESIYPIKATVSKQVRHTESVQRPRAAYPYFDLYPAVYPHFNLYPGPSCQGPPASSHSVKCTSKGVSSSYPSLVIYPSQYPHFDLYPPPAASMGPLKADSARSAISTRVAPGYPYFNLYPAVYPHFSIWPSKPVASVNRPVLRVQPAKIASIRGSFSAIPVRRLTPPPQPSPTSALPPVPTAASAKRASPPPQPAPKQQLPPVPMFPTLRRTASALQPATRGLNRSPSSARTVRILEKPRRTRSGRLTHSELHAMVMMEQKGLALDTLLEGPGPDESEISASLPTFIQNTEPSSTTSDAGPLRPFPKPSSLALSRSSTLPLRRPTRPVDPVDPSVRGSIYATETVRTRGLRYNTMSTINLEQKSPGLSRRMSLWDKGNTVASASSPTAAAPATHSRKRSRDSIVVQRIRTFNAQSAS